MTGSAFSGGGHAAHGVALLTGMVATGHLTLLTTGHPAALRATTALLDVPVDPDADTARRWARDELSKAIYHERPSLLMTLLQWIKEQWGQMQDRLGHLDVGTASIALVGLLLTAGVVAFVVAGPVRRARAARRVSVDVFGDDTRTAAQLRSAAAALAADGLWSQAVLELFRAMLRGLEERAVLDERPGRTAHEAAHEAGLRIPDQAVGLARAGRLFDDVCYGDTEADRTAFEWLVGLDEAVAHTRPAGTPAADREDSAMVMPR
ncbi:MAG TPA: DUF4129 domain-containing protein [Actinotalea sp.]|jgi:hypothetical protein